VGEITQIGGVRRVTLREGREEGVDAVLFRTGSGLEFVCLPGRGMDISNAEYQGQALAWRSATFDSHPAYYEPECLAWLRSFYGGLVVTCGLTAAGAPNEDEGKPMGLHGRISNTPAYAVQADGEWQGDEYVMWAQGKMRESIVFGENLEQTRRITARLGESKFTIHDRVENMGYQTQPLMLLYHINGGFPAIAEGGRLISATRSTQPRDAEAEEGKALYAQFQAPTAGYKEKVYYHELIADENGMCTTALVNEGFNNGQGFGFYATFNQKQLPVFTEWKMMDAGTYVVGMEPANCHVEGRAKERQRGTLQFIEPGEVRESKVEIGVLENNAQIQALEQTLQRILKSEG
jgi:hypothetical protein